MTIQALTTANNGAGSFYAFVGNIVCSPNNGGVNFHPECGIMMKSILMWLKNSIARDLMEENKTLTEKLKTTIKSYEDKLEANDEELAKILFDLNKCEIDLTVASNKSNFEKYLNNKNYPTTRLIYTKRWVLDKKNFPEMRDIRDFIKYYYSLPKFERLDQCFTNPIRYVSDNYAYNGILDVWQTAIETYTLGAGDCDDSGIYRACLSRKLGNLEVFCALGFWNNTGHLFNLLYDNGEIYIVENTSNKYEPVKIKTLEDTGSLYKICYIFNENNVWIVDGSVVFGGKVIEDFDLFGDANAVNG